MAVRCHEWQRSGQGGGGIPASDRDITYDEPTNALHVGTGTVTGVRPEVWDYQVSGMPILARWLGSRTAKGIGRTATRPAPLDVIRPEAWADEWNDELLDLVRVLSASIDLHTEQDTVLETIMGAPLLGAAELPQPAPEERQVPV